MLLSLSALVNAAIVPSLDAVRCSCSRVDKFNIGYVAAVDTTPPSAPF